MTLKTYTWENAPQALKSVFEKTRFLPALVTTKKFDPEMPMTIEGCANLAQEDRCGEIIPPEAWILDNFKKNPIYLLEHDRKRPIGFCTDIKVTKDGLYFTATIGDPRLSPLTADQILARSLLAQGILKTNSVGFIPLEIVYDEDLQVLRYNKAELLEISGVSVPMQQDSLITSVKNFGGSTVAEEAKKEYSSKDLHDAVKGVHKDLTDMHKSMKAGFKELAAGAGGDDEDEDDAKALKDAKRKVKALTTENDELKEQVAALTKENATLKTQAGDLQKSLSEMETDTGKLLDGLREQGHFTETDDAPAAN